MFRRYTEEERRQIWLELRAKGRKSYVWHFGVLRWGLPVFAVWTPLMFWLGPSTHRFAAWEIAVSLAGWTVAGYVYGRITWRALEKKYGG